MVQNAKTWLGPIMNRLPRYIRWANATTLANPMYKTGHYMLKPAGRQRSDRCAHIVVAPVLKIKNPAAAGFLVFTFPPQCPLNGPCLQ